MIPTYSKRNINKRKHFKVNIIYGRVVHQNTNVNKRAPRIAYNVVEKDS
jgi:hypothetical protein